MNSKLFEDPNDIERKSTNNSNNDDVEDSHTGLMNGQNSNVSGFYGMIEN